MKLRMRFIIRAFVLVCTLSTPLILAFDNEHFYRAPYLFFEPRFAKKSLSSIDMFIGHGSTTSARPKSSTCLDDCTEICLLDWCGFHNMHELAVGVPDKDLSNPLDLLITQLALEPARDKWAQFSIGGEFSITEIVLSYMHNFTDNFFIHAHLPIRRMSIDCITFKDLSPTNDPTPNINSPLWQAFKTSFDEILKRYDLCVDPFKQTAAGDLSLFAGWTYNFQDTEILDFVDVTFRAGVVLPTGKKQDVDQPFSLPSGHNDHTGFALAADAAFGTFDWLTLGAHVDAKVFANKTHKVRMKTGLHQSGLIYLAKGDAKIDRGNHLVAGAYIKADHFMRGFSATLAYSYARKSADKVSPCDVNTFCPTIVNSNECLGSWKMQTIHFFFEYDFTKENDTIGPRIGVFYNHQVSGRRVFKTNMVGATVGAEFMWQF